jgi:small subunit ribosomal protein S1
MDLQSRKLALKSLFDKVWLLFVYEPVSGIVTGVTAEALYVQVGHLTGRAHVSDMSWTRKPNLLDCYRVGQMIGVVLLGLFRRTDQPCLGLTGMLPDDWDRITKKYPVGSRHRASVYYLPPGWTLVTLEEPNLRGIVYPRDIRSPQSISQPGEVLAVGDMVDVEVLMLDQEGGNVFLALDMPQGQVASS